MGRGTKTSAAGWQVPAQRRWTYVEGRAMLAALEASGESDAGFARRHGIGLHRIAYWRSKLGDQPVARFVPVRPVDPEPRADVPAADVTERRVEVALPNGACLRFVGPWDAASIAPWLRAVGASS